MSGLEVAGIALGILPLLIKGVNQYSAATSGLKSLSQPRHKLAALERELEAQYTVFRANVRAILATVDLPSSGTDADDIDPAIWTDPALEKLMKEKFGHTYPVFIETIISIYRALSQCEQCLNKVRINFPVCFVINSHIVVAPAWQAICLDYTL